MFLTISIIALITASLFWPSEDAVSGSGLHLVTLWAACCAVYGMSRLRQMFPRRDDRNAGTASTGAKTDNSPGFCTADLAVLLIVGGHLFATYFVFRGEGDRRTAVNLTLEWGGLGLIWWLIRIGSGQSGMLRAVLQALVMIAVGLSALGIWQHHFFYAEQAARYRADRDILDQAATSTAGMIQAADVVARFQAQGIPLDGTDRVLWENRLLSSSEPFATFALANTLAGILAGALVLAGGRFLTVITGRADSAGDFRNRLPELLFQISVISYCLVLTKSRSAWAGAAAGLLLTGFRQYRPQYVKSIAGFVTAAMFLIMSMFGIAAMTGAVDREVILESPRSLQFRLMYWDGTLRMLKETPVVGAGPGNFRQLYLTHKAEESSEEIRDPHNYILEAWSGGGLIGLAGALLLTISAVQVPIGLSAGGLLRRKAGSEASESITRTTNQSHAVPKWSQAAVASIVGIVCGTGLTVGSDWLRGGAFIEEISSRVLLLTGILPALIFLIFNKSFKYRSRGTEHFRPRSDQHHFIDNECAGSGIEDHAIYACIALMIHLLAAGGFEFPGVMLVLLICFSASINGKRRSSAETRHVAQREWSSLTLFTVCSVLVLGCVVQFGFVPVIRAEFHLAIGDSRRYQQRNWKAAAESYETAIAVDPLSPVPRQRLAELLTYRLRDVVQQMRLPLFTSPDGSTSDDSLMMLESRRQLVENADSACRMWVSSDKRSCFPLRLTAQCLQLGSELLQDRLRLAEAIRVQQAVIRMYPTSVEDHVRLIRLYSEFESDEYRSELYKSAERTMHLERINRQWGHRDRYLSDEDRDFIDGILAGSVSDSVGHNSSGP